MIITCHRPIVLNPVDHKDLIIDKNNIKDNQRQAPFKPAKSLTLAMDKIIRNGILGFFFFFFLNIIIIIII